MAKHVLKDAVLTVDGNNISDHTSSVTLEDEAEEVELTTFGDTYRSYDQGLKDATITATVFNDYDASSIDSILEPLYSAGSTFTVAVKADDAATSSTNPQWSMIGRLYSYSPVAGDVGDANTTELTFRNAGTAGITRGTV